MEKERIEKIIHTTVEMCESYESCRDCPYSLDNHYFFDCALEEGVKRDKEDRNLLSIVYGRAIGNIIHSYCGKTSCGSCNKRHGCKFCRRPEYWEDEEEE